jgi:hypothetical protein
MKQENSTRFSTKCCNTNTEESRSKKKKKCEEHRSISLTTHSSKLLTGIVKRKIERELDYCLQKTSLVSERAKEQEKQY